MRYFVRLAAEEDLAVDVLHLPTGSSRIELDGAPLDVDCQRADGAWSVRVGARVWDLWLDASGPALYLAASGARLRGRVESEQARLAASTAVGAAAGGVVAAPMPGRVVKVLVASGDAVKGGQAVVVVEAMKMENELCAETDGVVKEILVAAGQTVDGGTALVRLSPAEQPAGPPAA